MNTHIYTLLRKWSAAAVATLLVVLQIAPLAFAEEVAVYEGEQALRNANTMVLDADDTGSNVFLQFGTTLGEQLYWDNTGGQFVFTDDVNITGGLDVDGVITAGSGDVALTNAAGLLDGEQIQDDTIDDDSIDFGTGADQVSGLDVPVVDNFTNSASVDVQNVLEDLDTAIATGGGDSTGTTSNIYTLDTDDTGGNSTLQFGTTLAEQFYWNNAGGQFELTDDLNIAGNITLTGTVDGVDVAALDTSVTDHLDAGANKHDADQIDVETAGNITTVANLETNLASFDTAVGDRNYTDSLLLTDSQTLTASLEALNVASGDQTYTNDNVVTDNESFTASIDALDTALGNADETIRISMNDLTVITDGTANLADLYNDNDTTNLHEFYILKTTQATLQDLDLKFKVRLPEDFVNFTGNTNDLSFYYRTDGTAATDNKIDILVEDDAGVDAFTAADGQGLVSAVANTWYEHTDEFDTAWTPAAGEYIYITVKGYGRVNAGDKFPDMGEILLTYTGSNK